MHIYLFPIVCMIDKCKKKHKRSGGYHAQMIWWISGMNDLLNVRFYKHHNLNMQLHFVLHRQQI